MRVAGPYLAEANKHAVGQSVAAVWFTDCVFALEVKPRVEWLLGLLEQTTTDWVASTKTLPLRG